MGRWGVCGPGGPVACVWPGGGSAGGRLSGARALRSGGTALGRGCGRQGWGARAGGRRVWGGHGWGAPAGGRAPGVWRARLGSAGGQAGGRRVWGWHGWGAPAGGRAPVPRCLSRQIAGLRAFLGRLSAAALRRPKCPGSRDFVDSCTSRMWCVVVLLGRRGAAPGPPLARPPARGRPPRRPRPPARGRPPAAPPPRLGRRSRHTHVAHLARAGTLSSALAEALNLSSGPRN